MNSFKIESNNYLIFFLSLLISLLSIKRAFFKFELQWLS